MDWIEQFIVHRLRPQLERLGISVDTDVYRDADDRLLPLFTKLVEEMNRHPEYRCLVPYAALYARIKEVSPPLYERIKEKVRSGQWKVGGSTWCVAEGSTPGGESIVRQILHGTNFFLEEFGVETKDLSLILCSNSYADFTSLPQILKKARIDYLLADLHDPDNRLSPPRTFHWQGIDGTRVFTHLLPAESLDRYLEPDFWRKAEADARDLPVWVGALRLQEPDHSPDIPSGYNRSRNRKAEFALRDAEFLNVISPAGLAAYPRAELESAWKTALLNQAGHTPDTEARKSDIESDYATLRAITDSLQTSAVDALAAAVDTRGIKRAVLVLSNLSHYANEAVTVPLHDGERESVAAVGPEGDVLPVQIITQQGRRHALFVARNAPLHGYAVWDLAGTTVPPMLTPEDRVIATRTSLENDVLRVEFDPKTGLITRIYDKDSEREILNETSEVQIDRRSNRLQKGALILESCANRFALFEGRRSDPDDPRATLNFAANEAQIVTELESVEVVESGPVRGAIRFVRTLSKRSEKRSAEGSERETTQQEATRIVQTVRLTIGSARLDFVTEVEWHENGSMLQVAFPVAINSPHATYEIPYGHGERPTYDNRSTMSHHHEAHLWPQKWADLSEGDYGVALLNDNHVGCLVQGNTLCLTLIRDSAVHPAVDSTSTHRITYSLLPHGGNLRDGEVIEHAYTLNSPPTARAIVSNQTGRLPIERSFFEVDNAALFIESIKKAEKEEAIIVRLYEGHNTRGTVVLTTRLPAKRAYLCDLLETNVVELSLSGGEVTLPVQPFEIITVKYLL